MQNITELVFNSTTFFLRAVFIYFFTLIVVRLMGKRSIGELSAFDFVMMASLGDIMGTAAIDKEIPLQNSMIVLATVALLELVLSLIGIKNRKLAKIIEGTPTLLIHDGKILKDNMRKEKFNIFDLEQELRKEGIDNEKIVDKAYIEACGKFTVILKEEEEPLKRKDVGLLKDGESPQYIDQRFCEMKNELDKIYTTLNDLMKEVKRIKDNGGSN